MENVSGDEKVTANGRRSGTRVNFVNLAITTIITVIIIELGIFLVFIGALFFATMFYLANAASVIEGRGPMDSLEPQPQVNLGQVGARPFF